MAKRNHKQDTIDNNVIEVVRPKVKSKSNPNTNIRYYHRYINGFIYIMDRQTGNQVCSCSKLESVILIEDLLNGKT